MPRIFRPIMSALPMLAIALAVTLITHAAPSKENSATKAHPLPWVGCDSLDVTTDGTSIHLLIGTNTEKGETKSAEFQHTKSTDGGKTWSAPVIISDNSRAPVPHHRGADARIIARGDQLFAAWTTPGTGFKGTGPMGTALSTDGGKTWQAGPDPADQGSTNSSRFLALTADEKAFHLVWLDDRNKLRGLRHASSNDGGKTWSVNATIDDYTCACCWNTIVHVPANDAKNSHGTLYTLYRDMKPSDMGFARSTDSGKTWEKLGHVGEFGWLFDGCPHVGGGLALGSNDKGEPKLFTAVWTGKPGNIGCHLFASDDQGRAWLPVRRLGEDTAKHPTIATQGKNIIAAWDDLAGDDRATFAITSNDGGKTWTQPQRLSAQGKQGTHVRVIANPANAGFVALWTESTGKESPTLRMTALTPQPLPPATVLR